MTDRAAEIRARLDAGPAFNDLPACDEYYEIIQKLANADADTAWLLQDRDRLLADLYAAHERLAEYMARDAGRALEDIGMRKQ